MVTLALFAVVPLQTLPYYVGSVFGQHAIGAWLTTSPRPALYSWEGHLPISYAIVREKAQPHKESPPYEGAGDEVDKILNCVPAHHGSLEFGSPVTAACAEAFILSQADMTDARFAEISTEGRKMLAMDPEARWTQVWQFLGGVFIGDCDRDA